MDPQVVDVLYYMVIRASAAEAWAYIPADERIPKEQLEVYQQMFQPDEDFAWGPLYPQLAAWLSDREVRRLRNQREGRSSGGGWS